MINDNQITALDVSPAIASLTLTKQEATAIAKVCDQIKNNLALEAQASPDALREKLHLAEVRLNTEGTEQAIEDYKEAARNFAGATEGFGGIQRSTAHRNEVLIESLKLIALAKADELLAAIHVSADQVAAAEQSAKSAFGDLSFADSFDARLQRTLDLLAEDRLRIANQGAALDRLCQWGLTENPYL